MEAIRIEGLSKRYFGREEYALDNLSITVKPGEIYGFLGPNGAGKSTTIRLLLGFIAPTKGTASIFGNDITQEGVSARRRIGYLSGDFVAYPKLTGADFLEYLSRIAPFDRRARVKYYAKLLSANLEQPIGTLSKGNRQKIGLIQAFMNDPDVLILDEPTSGLDPLIQEVFFELVEKAKKRGASAFVSSHNLQEVQKMCDRVGIIRGGKLVNESSIKDLAIEASQTFDIVFRSKPPLAELKKIQKTQVAQDGNKTTVRVAGDLQPLFKLLASHPVDSIATRELNLEEQFLHFYEQEKKR